MDGLNCEVLGKDKPYVGREDEFQMAFARWLSYEPLCKDALWFHVPNGGKRKLSKVKGGKAPLEAAKLKRMGVMAGVCDLIFMEPRGVFNGLVMELKVKGGKVRDSQRDFLNRARDRGFMCVVVYSMNAAIDVVRWYFDL